MRIKEDADKQQSTILAFRSKDISQPDLDDIHELRRLLHLAPDAEEIKLVFGATAANDKELAVVTRSMMQQMQIMATQAEVPAGDVAEGRAVPGWDTATNNAGLVAVAPAAPGGKTVSNNANTPRLIRILSSKTEPTDAFVTIHYRNHWFWIDDRDLKSKRTFSFMMMLFTLADTGAKEPMPLITIPAQ